jgi:hypothetical protein
MVGDTGLEQPQKPLIKPISETGGAESGALLAEVDLADLARRLAALPEADRQALAKALGAK